MRMIGTMADRMLSAVLPKTTAAACIDVPAGNYYQECYCKNGTVWDKFCVSTCYGPACGSCTNTGILC
jgi:hypothetical protein